MITALLILNAWFIPVPFFSMYFIKWYKPFEPNIGIGMAMGWPVMATIKLIWYINRKMKRKPEPIQEK